MSVKKENHTDEPPAAETAPVEPSQIAPVPQEIGRVLFEDASGQPNGAAIYHVPLALRDRTLLWRHQLHEQNHQLGDGTWVYRLTSTSGISTQEKDPQLEPIEPSDA